MIDLDQVCMDLLELAAPGVRVLPDVDNTDLWQSGQDPFSFFPFLFFSVSGAEASESQNTWDDGGPVLWDVMLTVTLLAEPDVMTSLVSQVTQGIRALSYTGYQLEDDPQSQIAVQRVRTTRALSTTGRSLLAGGKAVAQTTGTFTFSIKEI